LNTEQMWQKSSYKRKMIGLLMVISQLMLIAFTGKWLVSQYTEEKAYLRDKLESIYNQTSTQLVDSLINLNFSVPIKDLMAPQKSGKERAAVMFNTGIPDTFPYRAGQTSTIIIKGNQAITTANPPDSNIYLARASTFDSLPPVTAMSVRQLVAQLKMPSGEPVFLVRDSAKSLDWFAKKLQKQHLPLTVHWTMPEQPSMGIVLPTEFKSNLQITGYRPFLLKKISTQIGFSILLVLLCGCAFSMSYITVSRQIRLSAQKDSFISNMSHELKTPVATVKIAIEALKDFNGLEDPVKTHDYLQMATWEINRLETLIGNVLNSMQQDEGRIRMAQQDIPINQLLQDIIQGMQPLFLKHGKTMQLTLPDKALCTTGDPIHLQGALYNIIDNAIKYGGPDIRVTASHTGNHIHIHISDNGKGIPPEYRNKIFEKFFRIPSGNVHDVKGYGLGLNYAKYVVTAHAGQIYQQNNPEGGALFSITLPIKRMANES